jgi:hypothetical protein
MGGERDRGDRLSGESLEPSPLPPELAAFLRGEDIACLMQGTDQGTVFVIKLPSPDIESARGRVPIYLRYELYAHPNAPVIRTTLRIYDQPEAPLTVETFTNIEDENQRRDFAALAQQETFFLLFYDEKLAHTLTKVVPQINPEQAAEVLAYADRRLLAVIPKEDFDFERAKQAVIVVSDLL